MILEHLEGRTGGLSDRIYLSMEFETEDHNVMPLSALRISTRSYYLPRLSQTEDL
jgi:hypothetical protein